MYNLNSMSVLNTFRLGLLEVASAHVYLVLILISSKSFQKLFVQCRKKEGRQLPTIRGTKNEITYMVPYLLILS